MSKYGFGLCTRKPNWEYQSYQYAHECKMFAPAPPDAPPKRILWINKQLAKMKKDTNKWKMVGKG
jgi:hypothetical protein